MSMVVACLLSQVVYASETILRLPEPVQNLGESHAQPLGLGRCLDTMGYGWSAQIHAHACKFQGGDAPFLCDAPMQAIQPPGATP